MKYAIVHKRSAEEAGLRIDFHVQNPDKSKIILNENELRKLGDPTSSAKRLGGELVNRKELKILMNSKVWQNK